MMITTEESGQRRRSVVMRRARWTWLLSGATRRVRLESFEGFEEVQKLRRVLE